METKMRNHGGSMRRVGLGLAHERLQLGIDLVSVDVFQAFVDDPYLVGRVAALTSLASRVTTSA